MQHCLHTEDLPPSSETDSETVAISVIVPAYNSEETIASCLKSLRENTYSSFTICVVDDCSTDRTAEIARSFGCEVLRTDSNRGPGHARNLGARHVRSPILLFVDSDCVVPRDWVERYAELFAKRPDLACICSGYRESITRTFWAQFQFLDTVFNQQFTPEYPRWASSCNFGCRREAFWSIGGFPEIYLNEDMEFFFFLSEKHRLVWRADLGVSHCFPARVLAYAKQQFGWGKSVVETYLKYPQIFFSPGTIAAGNISLQLALLGITFPSILWTILWRNEAACLVAILCLLGHLPLNKKFLRFLKERHGLSFSTRAIFAIILRNTVWLLGMLTAAAFNAHRFPGFFIYWMRNRGRRDGPRK